MNRDEQRRNATEKQLQMLSIQESLDAMQIPGHQWSSQKIDASAAMEETPVEIADSTVQLDITQALAGVVNDAVTQISSEQQKKFEAESKAFLFPEMPKARRRGKESSPVKAFDAPISPTREDFDEFIRVSEKFLGANAEPFPLDESARPGMQKDRPGPRVAVPRDANEARHEADGDDVATAIGDFDQQMSRFAALVVQSIKNLNNRLDSLSRSLESEGYDAR